MVPTCLASSKLMMRVTTIPGKRAESREEYVVAIASIPEGGKLTVFSGKRHITLKATDWIITRVSGGAVVTNYLVVSRRWMG